MVVNGRPLKRMKRRVTADLSDFLAFPSGFDPPRGPFRSNVKAFLAEHALFPPPSSLFPHLMTWQISFRVGDLTEGLDSSPAVVSLDIVEEDVAKSRSVYCDQCRVVGWSGHPVCCKRYHYIIKADGNSIGGYHKPCTCCGDVLHISELRCKTCNHETTMDDVEDWVYHQLEDTSHLLHGVVHSNGYGHLLRVNGREGGSRVLSGCHIMDFWDRLCRTLGVRKVSVMDVAKKHGLEYRLLHAITKGHPWYGNWGYKFGAGSFALTLDTYNSAVETLSTIPLSIFLSHGPHSRLHDVIRFYQSLSGNELVNTRDLFCYLVRLIHDAQKSPSKFEYFTRNKPHSCSSVLSGLNEGDVERVQDAMVRVLRAVSGSNWVSWRALRGAVCKVAASPELLDHCLKELGGKVAADGMTVHTRHNPDSGALEYRLEPGNPPSNIVQVSIDSSPIIRPPSKERLIQDLKLLYEYLLYPKTMLSYGTDETRKLAINSSEKLLDCKQFVKEYPTENFPSNTIPPSIHLSCNVEITDQMDEVAPTNPPESVILAPNATLSDLKLEVSKAFQEVYIMYKRFQPEEVVGYSGVDDSTQVKLLVGPTGSVVVVKGRCPGKGSLGKFRMERGTERWTVDCRCGAKDDDGERMLACDVCSVWQHTRCSGIPDSDSVPAKFVCHRCEPRDE